MKEFFQKHGWLALTFFTFFFLLGSRSLNEPDEGRYAEIAREMIQTGDWLVPHLWYLPHLDKPPMTYWLVAISMKLFGQNEWAVRLPVALAGISGVIATFLLGCSLGGRRVGIWSALILQSSLLYFVMARFLTTDIFLTQFIAWAMYFFWRSWLIQKSEIGSRKPEFFLFHLAGWIFVALGFLTKGPIAIVIPAVAFLALFIFRRERLLKTPLFIGILCGFVLFLILAAPWFLTVFQRVPQSENFMIFGQAAGHFLGTTIKNRTGIFFYFFGILAVGLLPWTILLGWLWRQNHWRGLDGKSKDSWLLLSVWAIFTFTLFTFSHAKLPAYILPIFPALAILIAWRFFGNELSPRSVKPFVVTTVLSLLTFFIIAAVTPRFETDLRRNQTLKPLGVALRENFQTGDALVILQRLPEGLPFYSGDVISPANRPYFGGMDWTEIPFAFPGNRERAGDFILPDDAALQKLFESGRHILIAAPVGAVEKFQKFNSENSLRLVTQIGQWELFSNR